PDGAAEELGDAAAHRRGLSLADAPRHRGASDHRQPHRHCRSQHDGVLRHPRRRDRHFGPEPRRELFSQGAAGVRSRRGAHARLPPRARGDGGAMDLHLRAPLEKDFHREACARSFDGPGVQSFAMSPRYLLLILGLAAAARADVAPPPAPTVVNSDKLDVDYTDSGTTCVWRGQVVLTSTGIEVHSDYLRGEIAGKGDPLAAGT